MTDFTLTTAQEEFLVRAAKEHDYAGRPRLPQTTRPWTAVPDDQAARLITGALGALSDEIPEVFGPRIAAAPDQVIRAKIAEIEKAVRADERARLAAVIPPERFRDLADWFDLDDARKGTTGEHEVQDDLRKFAGLLEGR